MDIFGKRRKLIFFDEVDNIEFFGVREIVKFIDKVRNLIIMSVNYYWEVFREICNKV